MVRSIQQLEALGEEWNALADRFRTPLLDHDWFLSCAEAFYADRDLCVLTARKSGGLVGVAPLALEVTQSGPRLMHIGASRLFEPGGWLFASPEAVGELVASTVAVGHPLLLQRIPADSCLYHAFANVSRRRALMASKLGPPSLGVPIRQPWHLYVASLPHHLAENLRRWRRKAEREVGPVRFTCDSPAPGEVDDLLERFAMVEASGWKGRQGSALRARRDLRDFFRRYSMRAAASKRLRIGTLCFGSRIGAMEVSIEAYDRMWQLKIGYQEALSSYYPGLQLVMASIHHAFERGLDFYEFLGSAAPWQERWRPEPRPYRLVTAYPLTLRGVKGLGRDALGAMGRRWQRSLPAWTGPRASIARPLSAEVAC